MIFKVLLFSAERRLISWYIPGWLKKISSLDPSCQCSTLTQTTLLSLSTRTCLVPSHHHPYQPPKGQLLRLLWDWRTQWSKESPGSSGRAGEATSLQKKGSIVHGAPHWAPNSSAICPCGIFSSRLHNKLMKGRLQLQILCLRFSVWTGMNA